MRKTKHAANSGSSVKGQRIKAHVLLQSACVWQMCKRCAILATYHTPSCKPDRAGLYTQRGWCSIKAGELKHSHSCRPLGGAAAAEHSVTGCPCADKAWLRQHGNIRTAKQQPKRCAAWRSHGGAACQRCASDCCLTRCRIAVRVRTTVCCKSEDGPDCRC